VQADDYCLNACEENARGFKNTELYRRCGAPAARSAS
jgi:hypothetical protein